MRIVPIILAVLLAHLALGEFVQVPYEEWYDFGSIEFSGLDSVGYYHSPGDEIRFGTLITNNNPFPIVEGAVRVQIGYEDGEEVHLIDEFYAAQDVNLMPGEEMELEWSWTAPENAKEGVYRVETYFITSDSFNLAGVSFLRGLYGAMSRFEITGGSDLLHFDTAKLRINGEPHSLNSFAIPFLPEDDITVELPIKNDGSATSADIIYQLFVWDDLKPEDAVLQHEKRESVQLSAGQSRTLTYSISGLSPGAYLLKITAESPKNRAIVKMRIPVIGHRVKLNFAGMDTFPFEPGEEMKLFACLSDSATSGIVMYDTTGGGMPDVIEDGSLRLSLEADGKTILEDSVSNLYITGEMQGLETTFVPNETYRKLTLKVEASDGENTDSAEIVYDIEKLLKVPTITLEVSASGRSVTATVTMKKAGEPVPGLISLYAKNENGAVVYMSDDISMDGVYTETFELDPGIYTIKAVELDTGESAETTLQVSAKKPVEPHVGPAVQPQKPPDYSILIILIIILIIAGAVIFIRRRSNEY